MSVNVLFHEIDKYCGRLNLSQTCITFFCADILLLNLISMLFFADSLNSSSFCVIPIP